MNKAEAYNAIEKIWELTIKARALCPLTDSRAIGGTGYISPDWYKARGAVYFVNLAQPLTAEDVQELNHIGSFVNRSFIISMIAVLEEHGVLPSKTRPDRSKDGGGHVQLTKWLRNLFAHGEYEYVAGKPKHEKTHQLLKTLFPERAGGSSFTTPIDSILEPLKEGVLAYIRAA